jgi:uncharacterized protein YuzE
MIKTSYDPEADAFAAYFGPVGTSSVKTREVAPGVLLDFDAAGNVIGVEVLSVGLRLAGKYHGLREEKSAAE